MFMSSSAHVSVNFSEFDAVEVSSNARRYTANFLIFKASRHLILKEYFGTYFANFLQFIALSPKVLQSKYVSDSDVRVL